MADKPKTQEELRGFLRQRISTFQVLTKPLARLGQQSMPTAPFSVAFGQEQTEKFLEMLMDELKERGMIGPGGNTTVLDI